MNKSADMKMKWCVRLFLLLVLCAGFQLLAQQSDAARKSFEDTKAKAEKGNAIAQHNLSVCYDNGNGVKKDKVQAAKWLRKAAEQNFAEAQFYLGIRYSQGDGVEKDAVEAAKWCRKAAEQNHAFAQLVMGSYYCLGHGVEKDKAEGVKWWHKAAEQNNALVLLNLGNIYAEGNGVEKDAVEAVKWYRKAAEQNYAEAQLTLGDCYSNGDGVAKDEAEAANWYRKSAEQNYTPAEFSLGVCYINGLGVVKNFNEAVKWFKKAAEQNYAPAQSQLAVGYMNGEGVAKNYVEAYKWVLLAAAQGSKDVKEDMTMLEHAMSREQIAEGQKLAREFKPSKASEASAPILINEPADATPTATGTGFFITDDGYLISNLHVVEGAKQVRLVTSTGIISAKVVRVDAAHDFALLKSRGLPQGAKVLAIATSRGVKLGGTVATVGFPNIGLQGFAPKLAKGEIASLSGAGDDARYFQISVPVQPGNSGGALVDERGNVVGVVSAKLSAKAALAASGSLPENVNYAVKSSFLLSFLESVPEVSTKLKEPNTKAAAFEDVVKSAQDAAVLVLVY